MSAEVWLVTVPAAEPTRLVGTNHAFLWAEQAMRMAGCLPVTEVNPAADHPIGSSLFWDWRAAQPEASRYAGSVVLTRLS